MLIINDKIFIHVVIDKNPYYKVSKEDGSGSVSPNHPVNFPANSSTEIYFKAKQNTSVVHLRFTEFLSSGDVIDVYDPFDNKKLKHYNESDKLLTSVTSENDSARVVFTSGSSQDTDGRRFELVHRALPQSKDVFTYTTRNVQVAASLWKACCSGWVIKSLPQAVNRLDASCLIRIFIHKLPSRYFINLIYFYVSLATLATFK